MNYILHYFEKDPRFYSNFNATGGGAYLRGRAFSTIDLLWKEDYLICICQKTNKIFDLKIF